MTERRRPLTIVIAEDDPEDRLLLEDAFLESRLGGDWRFVEDGEQLLDYLHGRGRYGDPRSAPRPGVILLDLNMPRKDGREVLQEIKADPQLRQIPIIVLTTSRAEEDVVRAYDLGVNSFITKPVTFGALVEVIKTLRKYWFELVELPPSEDKRHMAKPWVTVLLVEDDEEDALLIRDWLAEIETVAFSVEWVATYEAAVAAIARAAHEVYLVDYRLGAHTGLEVLAAVQARQGQAVVIMLTGLGNRRVDEEALQAGAADYLVKGQVSADLLERSIRYALRQKRVEAALQETRAELEMRVQARTVELTTANAALRAEMAERKRTAQKLRESERLATIGATAAQLAHEIGNPLNGMATTVQLLERRLLQPSGATDEVVRTAVQDLGQEIGRLRALVQRLRTLARPRQLELHPTDVQAVAVEVLRREAPTYAARQIRVEQRWAAPLPRVMANADELTQVLLNLCKNAAEAMPGGGTLTVGGGSAGAHVAVEVRDTGEGIPDGVEIFEPFVTTKARGTGLGLAIVQQIIAAHEGTISYTSAPGQGATFTLLLPAVPGAPEEPQKGP